MDITKLYADRIGGEAFGTSTEIYKFEKIKRAKAAARADRSVGCACVVIAIVGAASG